MKDNIKVYYQNKPVCFRMSGDRGGKIFPLLRKLRKLVVLDAGCASGYVGGFVRKNGNYVIGIDGTRRDILVARKSLDEAYVFDLEKDDRKKFRNRFDYIIFSEVIEHLFEPEKVLKKLVGWLKPGGYILITTPNIVHIYYRWNFLLGRFNYKEDTVINRSHVHFFTYDSIKELIDSVKLKIINENHLIFPRTMNLAWKYFPRLFAHQLIFVCQKVA